MKPLHNERRTWNVYYFSGGKIRMKPYSLYSVHLWPSTTLNLKDRQLIHWGIQSHQCMLMGWLPGPAVSHHTTYMHNTVTMCVLDTAVAWLPLSLSRCLAVSFAHYPVSVLLSFLRLTCMLVVWAQACAPKLARMHINTHRHTPTAGAGPAAPGCFAGWIHTDAFSDCTIVI